MTSSSPVSRLAASAALIAFGAAGYWAVDRFVLRRAAHPGTPQGLSTSAPPARDAFVTLTSEMALRAGIETAPAHVGPVALARRSPGSVAANAYGQTVVSAVAGGTVTAVRAGLGDAVSSGQIVVEMFTRDHAEAEHMLLSAQAALEVAEKRRERSEKLAAIGGVSAQELDEAKAEEARQFHAVDEASARLRLLGPIRAPASGVVTSREVNNGQNVQPGAPLLTISDLSTVWVMAAVYERDLAAIRVGATARVTSRSYPGEAFTGRVTYLDPAIDRDSRTATARIEVANTGRKLHFGLLVDVEFASTAADGMLIPSSAVQQVGDRTVVFVADPTVPRRFEARAVELGASTGNDVEVRSGLLKGERVVIAGSFALRAELQRTSR